MRGIINKIKIPYNKTDQKLPYHKGMEPVCCTEKVDIPYSRKLMHFKLN